MSDSLTVLVGQSHLFVSVYDSPVLVYALLVSVYVGQSHCVSLFLVSFSLCRTVSLSDSLTVLVYAFVSVYVSVLASVYVGQSHCVVYALLVSVYVVSVYVGQSHCVGLCLVSFSLCRTVSLFQSMSVSVYVGQSHCFSLFLVSFSLCRTVSLCWSMPC